MADSFIFFLLKTKYNMIRILVTYATQGEFVEIPFPPMIGNEEVQAGYLRTGIGKVKSAFHLTNALKDIKPDVVLNVGTAGTASHQVGDVLVCRSFMDRDLQKTAGLGLEWQIDAFPVPSESPLAGLWPGNALCNTGDSFLTVAEGMEGDVADMEAYAQAFVCKAMEVPFIAVKYVTDILGKNSVTQWEDKLAEAREGLRLFFTAG